MRKLNTFLLASFFLITFSCSQRNGESSQKKDLQRVIAANEGVFTRKQAQYGAGMYANSCASCHGGDLRGTEGGNALIGGPFIDKWKEKSLADLFELTESTMPKTAPHSLDDAAYAGLLAFILNANNFPLGDDDLSSKKEQLQNIIIGSPPVRDVNTAATSGAPASKTIEADWLQHRGDYASTNYSPLDQINKDNVRNLKIAWRWKTDNFGPVPEVYFKVTPLMVNGVLYTTAGLSRTVAALDAETGETLWTFRFDERERRKSLPRLNSGRGVAYWPSGKHGEGRIISVSAGFNMIALDAESGRLITSFGNNGVVDLKRDIGLDSDAKIGSTSPPIIVNDVIIVGASFPVGLAPASRAAVRGDIMGYDVRTGKRLWVFHPIPQPGEEGNETWQQESWKYTGNAGAWAPLTADPKLGYVYLPLEAATGDFYGGHRPGNNLFSQSLVCLDAKTGKKVWHYQLIHHDIWDYDTPAPPILADINVDGKKIQAVVQVTKQAFAYVFDRVTGIPVWPIEERPVPKSDVKGEWTSPTQPFPTKPKPFDRQGYSEDILVDFTPEIKKEAIKIASQYRQGPLYTPITVYEPPKSLGTLMLPDAVGGANWQGGVLDPETGMLYVASSTVIRPMSLQSAPDLSDMDYVAFQSSSRIGPYGLPLVKPPYGRITAIDLNSGDHRWMIPNGDTPDWVKSIPALKGVTIPRTGTPDRVGLLVTKTLLFAGEGSGLYVSDGGGGNKFRAHDKATGEIISELELPANRPEFQ